MTSLKASEWIHVPSDIAGVRVEAFLSDVEPSHLLVQAKQDNGALKTWQIFVKDIPGVSITPAWVAHAFKDGLRRWVDRTV